MASDPAGTLAALAGIGYREVELHSLYRLSAAEFKKLLDANGLTAPATHLGLNQLRNSLPKTLEDAALMGYKWLIVPSLDRDERTADGYRRVADFFNQLGPRARQAGLRLGYHNHEYDLPPQADGVSGLEILIQNSDPAYVDFELDLFWARRGGDDPIRIFQKYPGRFMGVHIKDMAADGKMVNVGEGVMDFKTMLAAGQKAGVRHFFVEHDNPANPVEDARTSYTAVKGILP